MEAKVQYGICKWKILNATTLKLLAVLLMFLDHIHQMFVHVGAPLWLTMAGRLAFPIFLFVIIPAAKRNISGAFCWEAGE